MAANPLTIDTHALCHEARVPNRRTRSAAGIVLGLALAALVPLAGAQQGQTIRFSNWEFTPPQGMQKTEQTGDKLVFKLDKSIPGPGGTITLQAGQPLKGTLASRLDAEWKQLTKARKLLKTAPDEQTELVDGTKGLTRGASTANGGHFSITAYAAPNGVNLLLMDAGDEMATQMLGGTTFGFFMSLKVLPVGQATAVARSDATKATPSAETPLEELARLNKEMMQELMPDGAGAMQAPAIAEMQPMPQAAKPSRVVESIAVPRRDAARIKRVPTSAPGDNALADFVRRIEAPVRQKLPKSVQASCNTLHTEAKNRKLNAGAIGNIAAGLWIMGGPEAALCLMGKAVLDDPSNANNLNNYAALLTMAGGQHLALPILIKLDKDFPGNSTVLNNIAQAWFGLGDIGKADEYLDRTLRRFPGHSQANFTKSVVQESQGNKQAAVESMKKSMKQGYSEETEAQLERLGYDLTGKDIPWDEPFKEDPLKLHKVLALVPPYYFKAEDSPIAKAQWDAYHSAINSMKEQNESKMPGLAQANAKALKKFGYELVAGRKRFSPLAIKFTLKYITYGKRHEELLDQLQRWIREANVVHAKIATLNSKMGQQVKANKEDASCGTQEAIVTEFMSEANKLLADLQSEARIKDMIRWSNEWAQIFRYYNSPTKETYALYLNGVKSGFLRYMSGLKHYHFDGHLCSSNKASSPRSRKLVYFEDIHCQRNISFSVPMIGVIRMNCHYLTTEFDVLGIVKGSTKEDIITNEFVRGTLEIGVTVGGGSKQLGGGPAPVTAEGGVQAGGFIEIDKNGISDVGVTAGATAGVQLDGVPGAGVEIGVTTRIGLNSGVGVQGGGVLSGVSSQTSW